MTFLILSVCYILFRDFTIISARGHMFLYWAHYHWCYFGDHFHFIWIERYSNSLFITLRDPITTVSLPFGNNQTLISFSNVMDFGFDFFTNKKNNTETLQNRSVVTSWKVLPKKITSRILETVNICADRLKLWNAESRFGSLVAATTCTWIESKQETACAKIIILSDSTVLTSCQISPLRCLIHNASEIPLLNYSFSI